MSCIYRNKSFEVLLRYNLNIRIFLQYSFAILLKKVTLKDVLVGNDLPQACERVSVLGLFDGEAQLFRVDDVPVLLRMTVCKVGLKTMCI